MRMRISVVVVTYNRQEEAKNTVDSLVNQSVKPLEIIIIDNSSTPPLSMEVDGSEVRQIRLDEEVSKSSALNYAIGIAKGEYIAFLDDDCIASKHWIEAIQKGIRSGAEVLGGPLRPRFRAKPPDWWNEKDLGYFVGVGNSEKRDIWGANMVFKREVFRRIGFFNPKLGPQKGKRLHCEDIDLIARAKARCKVLFVPEVEVFHMVMPERLALGYIIRWGYINGKSLKIAYGPSKLAFYLFLKAMISFFNPFTKSEKSVRIEKVAIMAEQIGAVASGS
jgi:GT2 family glycosyltransferase